MVKKSKNNPNLINVYYTMTRRKDTTICDAWKVFSTFEKWAVNNGYESGSRIVRIDKRQPFSPSNTKIIKQSYVYNMNKQLEKLVGNDISKMRIKFI